MLLRRSTVGSPPQSWRHTPVVHSLSPSRARHGILTTVGVLQPPPTQLGSNKQLGYNFFPVTLSNSRIEKNRSLQNGTVFEIRSGARETNDQPRNSTAIVTRSKFIKNLGTYERVAPPPNFLAITPRRTCISMRHAMFRFVSFRCGEGL